MKHTRSGAMLMAVTVAVGLLVPTSAMAAVDMFLKMTGVTGESVDEWHRGEMDVLAWSWGASNGSARTAKGALPAACVQDLSFTKYIDSATGQLIMNGATGAVSAEAVLTVRKAGDSPFEYLVLRMTNVVVTSFNTGGSGGEDRLTEQVTLRFQSLRGEYRRMKADGTADRPVVFDIGGGNCR